MTQETTRQVHWYKNPFLWGLAVFNDVSIQAMASVFDVQIPSLVSESDGPVMPGLIVALAIAQLVCLLFFVRLEQGRRNSAWVEQRFLLPYFGLSLLVGIAAMLLVYGIPGVLGGGARPWAQGIAVTGALWAQWLGSLVIARTGRLRAVFTDSRAAFRALPLNERGMVLLLCVISGALQVLLDSGLDLGGAVFIASALFGVGVEVGLLRIFVLRL